MKSLNHFNYFILILSLTHPLWGSQFIDTKKLWKHVVSIDRLTWLEQEGSKHINSQVDETHLVRRLFLDTLGRLPTFSELKYHLESKDIEKRNKLIQNLLNSPGYALYYTEFWMDLLRIPHNESGSRFYSNHNAFHNYMRRSLHTNKPYDQIVKSLINAKGTYLDNPAVGFYMRDILTNYMDTVNSSIRVFLGTRIGCAQCHNHRFDKWTQKEFYEASAFFHGTKASTFGNNGFNEIIETHLQDLIQNNEVQAESIKSNGHSRALRNISKGHVFYKADKKLHYPSDYRYDNAKAGATVQARVIFNYGNHHIEGENSREQFANWMASKDNPVFAKVMANRLWKRLMGIGLMEPVDDFKDHLTIQNPLLYKLLGDIFIDVNYDFKAFLTILFNTQAYALQVNPKNEIEVQNYKVQGNRLRRMTSQQLSFSLQSFQKGPIEQYHRLDDDYFEFDDKLRSIGSQFLKTYHTLKRDYNRKHKDQYDIIDPTIRDLVLKTSRKITELEDYYQIQSNGLKNIKENNAAIAMATSSRSMQMIDKAMKMMGQRKTDDYQTTLKNAHQSMGSIKQLFGESDRSQPSNSGTEEATSLQILKLLSDPSIRLSVGIDSYLMQQMQSQKGFTAKVNFLFYSIYGRAPTKKDLKLALNFIDDPNELKAWGIFAHAMLNSPEFFFIQ